MLRPEVLAAGEVEDLSEWLCKWTTYCDLHVRTVIYTSLVLYQIICMHVRMQNISWGHVGMCLQRVKTHPQRVGSRGHGDVG